MTILQIISSLKYFFFSFQFDTDFSGQIEFPEFCNMMSAKIGTVNDEDMIRTDMRYFAYDTQSVFQQTKLYKKKMC